MSDIELFKDDTYDRIEKYYLHQGELSGKDIEICERLELAFALLCQHKNRKSSISKYISVLAQKGSSLSESQAYRDFSISERIFTPLRKYNKEFVRLVIIESAMKDIKEAERKASKTNDVKLWAEIMKIKDKAEKRMIAASGILNEDPNLPDFSKIQPSAFTINVDAKIQNIFNKMITKGTVDITEIFKEISNSNTHDFTLDDYSEESS